ncbi:PAS domain-containing protein [Nocardia sp. NPDC057353]|uniref:PAS domain-containing protein n=1 Tax=Nocardia sp. NPDC057353 TaxID=3346104 RepID=UPI00363D2E7A
MTGDAGYGRSDRVGDPAVVQQVFEQLPMMAAALAGTDLRYVAVNGATRVFACRDRMLGRPLMEAVPEVAGQRVHAVYREVLTSGRPQSLREWRARLDVPGSGPVEIFVDIDVTPWRDHDGEVAGVIVTAVDVTERVRERQAAQER